MLSMIAARAVDGNTRAMSQRFPKAHRLRKRRDYVAVQRGGRAVHGSYVIVASARASDPTAPGRVGFTVSKKVGNAVVRNRVKRWLREYARAHRAALVPDGHDVVVIAKPSAGALTSSHALAADLARVCGKLGAP